MYRLAVLALAALIALPAFADDKIGIFETIHDSSLSFPETTAAIDAAFDESELAPYPGVDHLTALPTDVLIVREAGKTQVLHYGQMWRMQLYFWDSGYRAFTANMNVPGKIVNSIEDAIGPEE